MSMMHYSCSKTFNHKYIHIVVVGEIWTKDIGLGNSLVDLLTRVAGIPGSISSPAIYMFSI